MSHIFFLIISLFISVMVQAESKFPRTYVDDLVSAIENGDLNAVKSIVEKNKVDLTSKMGFGVREDGEGRKSLNHWVEDRSTLTFAADSCNEEMLKYLITIWEEKIGKEKVRDHLSSYLYKNLTRQLFETAEEKVKLMHRNEKRFSVAAIVASQWAIDLDNATKAHYAATRKYTFLENYFIPAGSFKNAQPDLKKHLSPEARQRLEELHKNDSLFPNY